MKANGTNGQWTHDRMRFETMDEKQLTTRLRRIGDMGKLERFVVLATEFGYKQLAKLANVKLLALRYELIK